MARSPRARPPAGYDVRDYPTFAVTVDLVVLTVVSRRLHLVLVERRDDPFAGHWALPGGFKKPDESLEDAARRELREETGLDAPGALAQFGAYGDPDRDPRGNVVTIAYLAVDPSVPQLVAGSDAADARLHPLDEVLEGRLPLAFDHRRIVADAADHVKTRLHQSDLATAFVREPFTLAELRDVYEASWGVSLDPANFRRALGVGTASAYVEPSGDRAEPGPDGGRPAERFRATDRWELSSPVKPPRPRR